MKLVIGGATGFLGKEVLSQALQHPKITSVVALARRETPLPEQSLSEADRAKFKAVACEDFNNYPENVKVEIADADACIWLIAITPTKSKTMAWEEVRKICVDYAVNAVDTFSKLPRTDKTAPFRFLYISGSNAERDPAKKPWILGDYCIMRGQVETQVLERAGPTFEVAIAKPGLINNKNVGSLALAAQSIGKALINLPNIRIDQMAAALLDQVVTGFRADTIENAQLIEIGQKVLDASPGAQ